MEDKLSARTVYKMIKNYLANELGVNRNYIDDIVASHVRDRNIEAMVKQEVDRYIHNKISWTERSPDGMYVDGLIQKRIVNLVDKYVKEHIEQGVGKRIRQIVDIEVDRILANVSQE